MLKKILTHILSFSPITHAHTHSLSLFLSLSPQALALDGNFVDDFVIKQGDGGEAGRVLHVVNAPSPAATSSMAIAEMLVERALSTFRFGVGELKEVKTEKRVEGAPQTPGTMAAVAARPER